MNVELFIRLSRSILSPRLQTECRALYSALQVHIQLYIQHLNVELYIRPYRSIDKTIFVILMVSSIFNPPGLYSAQYSTSECRALYSALQVYIQHYIQYPNAELCIQSSRSIFNAIFKLRMKSSISSPSGLYSALYSTSDWRALNSVLQVYIQQFIQHPNVELCIQSSRHIFSARFKNRM